LADQIDVVATAKGGGVGGQAGAVSHGPGRAISKFIRNCALPVGAQERFF